jgi:ribonuclease VapC
VILDASALIAILRAEPEAEAFADALAGATAPAVSAASYLEAGIVIDAQRDPVASRLLDLLIDEFDIAISAVTATQARIARQAYRDFGKGSGHPARLNFGDCFSYALAIERRSPLLFKGADFPHTDVLTAL